MSELIIYYILPNIVLFGSIYGFSKFIEYATWQMILKKCR
jgi:hypothetical protein